MPKLSLQSALINVKAYPFRNDFTLSNPPVFF